MLKKTDEFLIMYRASIFPKCLALFCWLSFASWSALLAQTAFNTGRYSNSGKKSPIRLEAFECVRPIRPLPIKAILSCFFVDIGVLSLLGSMFLLSAVSYRLSAQQEIYNLFLIY